MHSDLPLLAVLGVKERISCPLMLQFRVMSGLLEGCIAITVVSSSDVIGSDALPGGEQI